MVNALNFTNAESFQAYIRKYHNKLFTALFLSNKTAAYTSNHEGIKSQVILTKLVMGDIYRRWRAAHDPVADAVDFIPRTLSVVRAKADLDFAPSEFEGNYLGDMRQKGQNPKDFPFQAYIFENILKKGAQEIENAMWKGVASGAPAQTDKLIAMLDGYLKLITDAITATDITPYVSGALTSANIVGHVEAMWGQLGTPYKEGAVDIYMSYQNYQKFVSGYRDAYGKYTGKDMSKSIKLDFGNANVVPIPGMGTSSRIVVTPRGNLNYAYDAKNDQSLINIFWNKRVMETWTDMTIGVDFAFLDDASGAIIVNDQV